MPTEKFLNLAESKKQVILDAVREEFLTHAYSDLRVTAIIRRAGISRASFYLYFQDKEDLFVCMLEQLDQRIKDGLLQCFREENGVFSRALMRMLDAVLEENTGEVFSRVIKHVNEDASCSDIVRQLERRLHGTESRSAYAARCSGLLNPELYAQADITACRCAIDMGFMVLVQALTAKSVGGGVPPVRSMAQKQLEILENGLRAQSQA